MTRTIERGGIDVSDRRQPLRLTTLKLSLLLRSESDTDICYGMRGGDAYEAAFYVLFLVVDCSGCNEIVVATVT